MPDYYKVKIGDTWLTNDGTDTGIACKISPGAELAKLWRSKTGGTQNAADNTPWSFVTEFNGEGVVLKFAPGELLEDEYDDLMAELDALDPTTQTIQVLIEDGPGPDLDLECIPLYPDWVEHGGEFIGERVMGLVFNLAVKEKN